MPFPNRDSQFPPGTSGNPAGRPAGRSLAARLRDLLDRDSLGGRPIPDGKRVADLVVEALVKYALTGKAPYMQMLLDRADGTPQPPAKESGDVDARTALIERAKAAVAAKQP